MSAPEEIHDALRAHGTLYVAAGGTSGANHIVHTRDGDGCRALARAAVVREISRVADIPRQPHLCKYCTNDIKSTGGSGEELHVRLREADPEEVSGD